MIKVNRFEGNPILSPDPVSDWEKEAVFNGCVTEKDGKFYILYRAMSSIRSVSGHSLELSTIGCAEGKDRIHFDRRRQFIFPEEEYERFGCEDPRVTRLDGKYYIFYTALSEYPFAPSGIKIAVAVTRDFSKIEEKHLVTDFNSKAMSLFPERINGKIAAILTANTDIPPSTIGIALFDDEKEIWDRQFWKDWYSSLEDQALHLLRSGSDHIEIGASPVKTKEGWLLIYCYIRNYLLPGKVFAIEAALLDYHNPYKVLGTTREPLLVPERDYELYGKVPNVIFPSGVQIFGGELGIYYGGADTTVCLATCNLKDLLSDISPVKKKTIRFGDYKDIVDVFDENPIIKPVAEHKWESKYTFNPAAVLEKGKVHIVYRAMGEDNTSVLGYASSRDGFRIDERLEKPVYEPREIFEKKYRKKAHSGCEDPRITKIGDRFYMCYTAYDGKNPPRVAITSIKVDDFLNKIWSWKKPVAISTPKLDDKNACILPEKIRGKYAIFHRLHSSIWIDYVEDLEFEMGRFIKGEVLLRPRPGKWDSEKVGIGPVPIKTEDGWLLIYHSLCREDKKYRLGAALLDLKNPLKLKSRLKYPILEPFQECSNNGLRKGTVFACGAVETDSQILIYYGGADQFVCVAEIDKKKLMDTLKKNIL